MFNRVDTDMYIYTFFVFYIFQYIIIFSTIDDE